MRPEGQRAKEKTKACSKKERYAQFSEGRERWEIGEQEGESDKFEPREGKQDKIIEGLDSSVRAIGRQDSLFNRRVTQPDFILERAFRLWNEEWSPAGQFWRQGESEAVEVK